MITAPDFCMDRDYPERRKPATTPSPSEGITSDQVQTPGVAVVTASSAFLARYATSVHPNGDPALMATDLLRIAQLARNLSDSPVSFLTHMTRFADDILPNK